MTASVYRMTPVPDIGQSIDSLDSATPGQLELVSSLENKDDTEISRLLWQPNEGNKLLTITTDSRINIWDFSSSSQIQVWYNWYKF